MKQLIGKVVCICLIVMCIFSLSIHSNAAANGSLSKSVLRKPEDGCLTISGTGEIPSSPTPPWYDQRKSIISIVIIFVLESRRRKCAVWQYRTEFQ